MLVQESTPIFEQEIKHKNQNSAKDARHQVVMVKKLKSNSNPKINSFKLLFNIHLKNFVSLGENEMSKNALKLCD